MTSYNRQLAGASSVALLLLLLLLALGCHGRDRGPRGGTYPAIPPTADAGAGTTPPPAAPSGAQRAFVTSLDVSGNIGGLIGADSLCQASADAAGLGGTYRAWLSSSRVAAIDRVTGQGPWFNVDGEMVFANRSNLQTTPVGSLDVTEQGDFVSSYQSIWTGTSAGGRSAEDNCNDWTSEESYYDGQQGRPVESDSDWTSYTLEYCDYRAQLYCFEVR